MAPYAVAANAGQAYFPVPGGVVPGLNIVAVGGALLSPGDFDDSDGLGILLAQPLAVGTQFQLYAMGYNTGYVPVGGQLAPFRNKLINGNFDVWQRGTSLGAVAGQARYLADRWLTTAVGSTVAPSQQAFTLGQTAVPGEPTFFHRTVVASSAGAGNYALFTQPIEGVRTLAGQSAVLSFWAKADATKNIAVEFVQGFGTGGSPSAPVSGIGVATKTLATGWTQFKVPVTLPGITGKTLGSNGDDQLQVIFWFDAGSTYNARTNSLGQQSGTFDIARVQLERGSVATDFEERHIQKELALAQRYYQIGRWRLYQQGATNYCAGSMRLSVAMRATPTCTFADNAGNASKYSTGNQGDNQNTLTAGAVVFGGSKDSVESDFLYSTAPGNWIAFNWTAAAEL
jgi:hypothetical protein